MREKDILLKLIDDNIKRLLDKINSEKSFNKQKYESLKKNIRAINEDSTNLVDVDLNEIKSLNSIDESDFAMLEFYKNIMSIKSFKFGDYEKGTLRMILAKINTFIIEKEDKNKAEDERLGKLKTLFDKVNNGLTLNSEEIDLIYVILNQSDVDINKKIKLMRFVAETSIGNFDLIGIEDDNEEEEISIEETNLDVNDLIEIFRKHNSDFNKISKSGQDELQKFGKLDNIESIFSVLEKFNINSIDAYLSTKSLQLCRVFIYSNANLVQNVFELCQKYNLKNENGTIDFLTLLKTPSKFIKRKRKWKKKIGEITGPGGFDSEVGAYEDFEKNLEFFANEGLDIGEAFRKSSTYFDLPYEHIQIGVKNLKLYGIGKELYLNTLSCFDNRKQADAIDQFIELGYFEYVKSNLSRAALLPDAPMFYKIARANQLGLSIPKIRGNSMSSDITYNNKEYLGINNINGAAQTRKYTPRFINSEYFDFAINSSDNNNIILSKDDELIKILDERFLSLDEEPKVYLIAGVRISRMKVLRIYNTLKSRSLGGTLDSIMYTITKNSIITEEQYKAMLREISMLYNTQYNSKRIRKVGN